MVDPPLWKMWVRQLGWWHSQYFSENNTCLKPPTSMVSYGLLWCSSGFPMVSSNFGAIHDSHNVFPVEPCPTLPCPRRRCPRVRVIAKGHLLGPVHRGLHVAAEAGAQIARRKPRGVRDVLLLGRGAGEKPSHISEPWCCYTYMTGWFWTRANVGIQIPAPWSIWPWECSKSFTWTYLKP